MLVNDESHKGTLIFTFTTNAFLLKQKYLFTVAFELPPAHTNPQKMLILIRKNFLQRVCSKRLFKVDHLLSFLFNKYEVSNFYQTAIATSRFKDTFVFSYLISHDSTRYISFTNIHHFFPVKIISIINAVMTTYLIYCI